MCIASVVSQCFTDDRILEPVVGRSPFFLEWKSFTKDSSGATIVPVEFDEGLNTHDYVTVMREIMNEMKSSCPVSFVHNNGFNRRNRLILRIQQDYNDDEPCRGTGVAGVVKNDNLYKTPPEVLLVMTQRRRCAFDGKVWDAVLLHEMFHAFGIGHTQKRNDRDKYVEIINRNIIQNKTGQFTKCEQCQIPKLADGTNIPYECSSLMHYRSHTFGQEVLDNGHKTRKRTIKERKCPQDAPLRNAGQEATENDWRTLKIKLGCPA